MRSIELSASLASNEEEGGRVSQAAYVQASECGMFAEAGATVLADGIRTAEGVEIAADMAGDCDRLAQVEPDYSKATKADDAAVPVEIWDKKVWALGLHSEDRRRAFEERWSAVRREQGWEQWQRKPLLRDGFSVWLQNELPNNRKPQRGEKDPEKRRQMFEKLNVARLGEYIQTGDVKSLTGYFWVPKGPTDIRMVYDATKSKLNQALWTPSFSLPSVESLVRQLEESTWMADLDLGDMFLNFMLDVELRPYCGWT